MVKDSSLDLDSDLDLTKGDIGEEESGCWVLLDGSNKKIEKNIVKGGRYESCNEAGVNGKILAVREYDSIKGRRDTIINLDTLEEVVSICENSYEEYKIGREILCIVEEDKEVVRISHSDGRGEKRYFRMEEGR